MDGPERIDAGVYEVYRYCGYTIQRSDQPGYTDRWFVYRERRPFRALLRGVDQELVTFGSLEEAVAWLTQNPDALPELGDHLPCGLAGAGSSSPEDALRLPFSSAAAVAYNCSYETPSPPSI